MRLAEALPARDRECGLGARVPRHGHRHRQTVGRHALPGGAPLLIDIRDPAESYSAGEFTRDAALAMEEIWRRGRQPLLVGGTMLYFHALSHGIAMLPKADAAVRASIEREAASLGWRRCTGNWRKWIRRPRRVFMSTIRSGFSAHSRCTS